MARLKRVALIATFILFAVIGTAMAVFAEGSDRILGVVTVLFFGGGGASWFVATQPRRRPAPGFVIGAVPRSGGDQPAFIARTDRRRGLVIAAGALVAGVGALLVPLSETGSMDDVERLLFIGCGALFIGVGVFSVARINRGASLAMTREGLTATGPAGWFVPWSAIVLIGESHIYGNPMLVIRVDDPAVIEMGFLQRVVHRFQRWVGPDLSFPMRTLAVEPDELYAGIRRYLERPEHRGRIGLADELREIRSSVADVFGSAQAADDRPERPLRWYLGVGSLLCVGGLLALASLILFLAGGDDPQARARLLGVALVAILALAQVGGGVLLIRGHRSGRWIGVSGALATLALALLGLVRSDPDIVSTGIVIVVVMAIHFALVVIGARVADPSPALPRVADPSGA